MKLRVPLLFMIAAAMTLAGQVSADEFLLGYSGFDYSVPHRVNLPDYLQVGDQYVQVGTVTSFGPMISGAVNPVTNWYTHYMFNMVVSNRLTGGTFIEAHFSNATGGRARCYEDAQAGGTAPVYGINPPNATVPSTFSDGTVILGGPVTNFVITYDFGFGQGDFIGDMVLDEGSDLSYIPTESLPGWILGGLSGQTSLFGPPNVSVPDGYDHQVNGEWKRQSPTPSTHKTWGAIKALYR